jgi:hypothetical protein
MAVTKLIEIPFDASLIGQEGIVVKYRNGEVPDFVKVYSNRIRTIDSSGGWLSNKLSGSYGHVNDNWDLIMYREIETMTLKEWTREQMYVIHQEIRVLSNDYRCGYDDGYKNAARQLAAALKNGEVEL